MQLDLDTDVLKVRDQSSGVALTDQYPGIEILTKDSRLKFEFLVFMGVLGLVFAIKTGKRKKYAH